MLIILLLTENKWTLTTVMSSGSLNVMLVGVFVACVIRWEYVNKRFVWIFFSNNSECIHVLS